MPFLNTLFGPLSRYASKALPCSLVIGLLIPALASWANQFLYLSLLLPLTIAISRIQWQALFDYLHRWQLMLALTAWMLIASPLIVWALQLIVPLPESLSIALITAAAAPPVTACAALALFLGLDIAIVVIITIITMLLVPLTFPWITYWFTGLELSISLYALGFRLCLFIFLAFALAIGLKKILGEEKISHYSDTLNGIAVISISLFIIGIMKGVTSTIMEDPTYALITTASGFGMIITLQLVSGFLFWKLPKKTMLAIAMMAGNCNLGLVYLVLADQSSINTLVFFALGQIPLYMLPALQEPIYKKVLRTSSEK